MLYVAVRGSVWQIVPWAPEHAGGAVAAVKAVYDEYGFTWDEADYHADLYDVPGFYLSKGLPFLVAIQDGRVVGTVALDLFDRLPGTAGRALTVEGRVRLASADCALERLYVHPAARRQGVGAGLLEASLAEARARERRSMEIWSDKRFQDAHRLYQRYGAVVVTDRICHDPDVSPEWGLILEIAR
jgi:GNAT superfamily N-acetyltransferase